MGFSRQKYWSELPCPPSQNLPDRGIEPESITLQADSLSTEPSGKPSSFVYQYANINTTMKNYQAHIYLSTSAVLIPFLPLWRRKLFNLAPII